MANAPLNLTGTTEPPPHDVVSTLLGFNGTLGDGDNSTSAETLATISSTVMTTTISSLQSTTTTESLRVSMTTTVLTTATKITNHHNSPLGLIFISTILFVVALLITGKIVYSYRWKRKTQMLGSARWLPTNASNVAGGTRRGGGGAVYSAMPVNMMDTPRPESRLDWERQFFEDDVLNNGNVEEQTTTPSRLQLAFR